MGGLGVGWGLVIELASRVVVLAVAAAGAKFEIRLSCDVVWLLNECCLGG